MFFDAQVSISSDSYGSYPEFSASGRLLKYRVSIESSVSSHLSSPLQFSPLLPSPSCCPSYC